MSGRLIYRAPPQWRAGRPEHYYGFLESRDQPVIPPDPAVDVSWPADVVWPEAGVARLGLSVVPSARFRELTRGMWREGEVKRTGAWRQKRREQLSALFERLPPRRLELFPSLDPEGPAGLQVAFRPGGWFRVAISGLSTGREEVLGQISGPGDAPPTPVSLRRLGRVSALERAWLRKVFSLDHISDLGFEGPEGEPGPSPPDTPPRVPGGRAAAVVFGAERLWVTWPRQFEAPVVVRQAQESRELGPKRQTGMNVLLAEE